MDAQKENLRSGPCSTVAPQPTAVQTVPAGGPQPLGGRQTGRTQRFNRRGFFNFINARSFLISARS